MYTSFVLVKNLTSSSNCLRFSNFEMTKIEQGEVDALKHAQSLFGVGIPLYGDWVYRRTYHGDADPLEKISVDVEDTLFLLRLFRVGDLVFLHPVILEPDGNKLRQLPYRVMSRIHRTFRYSLQPQECHDFDAFALEITGHSNSTSTWFQTARRFFLYGGSKEFNPLHKEVDRIVDYMISLEAILVPERDFLGRRLRERAAALLRCSEENRVKHLIRDFYGIRSTVVHGSTVEQNNDSFQRSAEFEDIVRRIMIESLRQLPSDDPERESFLKGLFDVSDLDRAEQVYRQFCAIQDQDQKRLCLDRMANRA